jgi:hypothetical protein
VETESDEGADLDDLPPSSRTDFGDGLRLSRRGMVLVALVALVPVLSAIGVVILLSLGTGQPASPAGGPDAAADAPPDGGAGTASGGSDGGSNGGSGSSDPGSGEVQGAPAGGAPEVASPDDAAAALREAGVGRIGAVEGAWTWRDGTTTTLVAVTRRVTRRNSDLSARAVTLRVSTVADPGGRPKLLASVEDPGQTCERDVTMVARVAPKDVLVKDLDADGTREVLVAWVHACGPDVRRRATVLAGQASYALEGRGSQLAEPDPPIGDWPDGFLDAASGALDSAG